MFPADSSLFHKPLLPFLQNLSQISQGYLLRKRRQIRDGIRHFPFQILQGRPPAALFFPGQGIGRLGPGGGLLLGGSQPVALPVQRLQGFPGQPLMLFLNPAGSGMLQGTADGTRLSRAQLFLCQKSRLQIQENPPLALVFLILLFIGIAGSGKCLPGLLRLPTLLLQRPLHGAEIFQLPGHFLLPLCHGLPPLKSRLRL